MSITGTTMLTPAYQKLFYNLNMSHGYIVTIPALKDMINNSGIFTVTVAPPPIKGAAAVTIMPADFYVGPPVMRGNLNVTSTGQQTEFSNATSISFTTSAKAGDYVSITGQSDGTFYVYAYVAEPGAIQANMP